jgi:hypothetical protein
MKLTAEQSARLAVLTAREDLDAAEQAEVSFLQNLAAQADADPEENVPAADEILDEPELDAPADPEASAPAKKPSVFERAMSAVQGRSALLADLSAARLELASAIEERNALAAQIADLTNRADAGEAFAARVAELESERHTVSQAAARIAASSHVEPDALPETSEDEIETLETVREKLASETDPKERSRLAKKARALRETAALN